MLIETTAFYSWYRSDTHSHYISRIWHTIKRSAAFQDAAQMQHFLAFVLDSVSSSPSLGLTLSSPPPISLRSPSI